MTPARALTFVERHGIVLQSAKGPVPNLVDAIAGESVKGSWWGHPKSQEIFGVLEAVLDSDQVLPCRLVDGKVTFVHRRLWPALVRLSSHFRKSQLAREWSEHTASGAHRKRRVAFPKWVPGEVGAAARRLSEQQALRELGEFLHLSARRSRTSRSTRSRG